MLMDKLLFFEETGFKFAHARFKSWYAKSVFTVGQKYWTYSQHYDMNANWCDRMAKPCLIIYSSVSVSRTTQLHDLFRSLASSLECWNVWQLITNRGREATPHEWSMSDPATTSFQQLKGGAAIMLKNAALSDLTVSGKYHSSLIYTYLVPCTVLPTSASKLETV